MAFSFDLSAGPLSLTINATAAHLAIFWGRSERGFVLERGYGPNPSGKPLEAWRNPGCGTLNAAAFGLHLMVDCGNTQH